jgi:hypothetical protein
MSAQPRGRGKNDVTIAELLFMGTGLAVALSYVAVEPAVATSVIVGIFVMGSAVVGLLLWQRAGCFVLSFGSAGDRVLTAFVVGERFCRRPTAWSRVLGRQKAFRPVCLGFFLGWVAGIVEVWAFLSILRTAS